MSWRRISVPACLMALSLSAGVASGQGDYSLQQQGQQPLRSDLATREQQGLNSSKSKSKTISKPKPQKAPWVAGVKQRTKGTSPKSSFLAPSSGHQRMEPAKGAQTGVSGSGLPAMGHNQSGSSGSTSFLDNYLLNSLHNTRPAKKKGRSEDKSKDVLPLKGKTTSKF